MELQHPSKAGLQNAVLYMRTEAVALWNYLNKMASANDFAIVISGVATQPPQERERSVGVTTPTGSA